jgi:hypothetical protein
MRSRSITPSGQNRCEPLVSFDIDIGGGNNARRKRARESSTRSTARHDDARSGELLTSRSVVKSPANCCFTSSNVPAFPAGTEPRVALEERLAIRQLH